MKHTQVTPPSVSVVAQELLNAMGPRARANFADEIERLESEIALAQPIEEQNRRKLAAAERLLKAAHGISWAGSALDRLSEMKALETAVVTYEEASHG